MFAGQVMTGGVLSTTVTVNVQPGPDAAVQVTVVVPMGKNDPDGGLQVIAPQLPVVAGSLKVTAAPHWPGSLLTLTLAGQVSVQAGFTVTEKLQVDV
jgi:hypothetical protein